MEDNSKTTAWLLSAYGEQSKYAGHLGYADEISKVYRYRSPVGNCRKVSQGHIVLLRDKDKLIGIAKIENIDTEKGIKKQFYCPECDNTNLGKLQKGEFKYFCKKSGKNIKNVPIKGCGLYFNEPGIKEVECTNFSAYFGNSFIAIDGEVDIQTVIKACPRYNAQISINEIDFSKIEEILLINVSNIKKILINSAYINTNDAEDIENDNDITNDSYYPIIGDYRESIFQQIKIRRGQHKFREDLKKRYNNQCLVTGCKLIDILEAAHISPYRGKDDNHSENGLLLRADIHTLFDLDLMGIEPESLTIKFHQNVLANGYDCWEGRRLLCLDMRPSKNALISRWKCFTERLQSTL